MTGTIPEPPTTPTHDEKRLFAPLNIPFHRRVQTAAVFLLFSLPILILLLNLYCLILAPWYIQLPYLACLAYCLLFLTAHKSGHSPLRSAAVRSAALFRYFRDYFPITLYPPEAELPADRSYILGYHPHGIISVGAVTAFASEACGWDSTMGKGGLVSHMVTLDVMFRIPLWNVVLLCCGVVDSSQACIDRLLSRSGAVVCIVLGGASESLDAFVPAVLPHPEPFITPPATPSAASAAAGAGITPPAVIRSLSAPSTASTSTTTTTDLSATTTTAATAACRHPPPRQDSIPNIQSSSISIVVRASSISLSSSGSTLLPTFAFGELSLFTQLPNPRGSVLRRLQERIQRMVGFATPLIRGRGILNYRYGILPQRHRVDIRIGEPIAVEKVAAGAVSGGMVDELHERYKRGLVELFEKWKDEYEETRHAVLVFVD